mmetsp:Transcript_81779/g.226555  ORF Transcript_81779/g.226555 Transcript_81779/m.226555 type:complete len:367 (-) Transcript_81779:132-1232(-)
MVVGPSSHTNVAWVEELPWTMSSIPTSHHLTECSTRRPRRNSMAMVLCHVEVARLVGRDASRTRELEKLRAAAAPANNDLTSSGTSGPACDSMVVHFRNIYVAVAVHENAPGVVQLGEPRTSALAASNRAALLGPPRPQGNPVVAALRDVHVAGAIDVQAGRAGELLRPAALAAASGDDLDLAGAWFPSGDTMSAKVSDIHAPCAVDKDIVGQAEPSPVPPAEHRLSARHVRIPPRQALPCGLCDKKITITVDGDSPWVGTGYHHFAIARVTKFPLGDAVVLSVCYKDGRGHLRHHGVHERRRSDQGLAAPQQPATRQEPQPPPVPRSPAKAQSRRDALPELRHACAPCGVNGNRLTACHHNAHLN